MNRNYFNILIILALLGLALVGLFMWQENENMSHEKPLNEITLRPVSPFRHYISAIGIVEASSGNINIGSPLNRIVENVEVKVGEKIKTGQVLFRLESRDLMAELHAKTIAYENAVANLQKLEALPRREDVIAQAALLKNAEIARSQAKSQYERVVGLQNSGSMSEEAVMQRQFAYQEAEAKYQKAEADFEKIKAGTWIPDLEIARLHVEEAEADKKRIQTEIERTIITSPIEATVLQIKIHKGEFPPLDPTRSPSMIIGNMDILNLRVNINQFDAPYYRPSSPAVAFLQGNADLNFPLHFVRVEPILVTKQNITNEITEKIDTRVLQAIYSFKEGENRLFVGQQMDVFIENIETAAHE